MTTETNETTAVTTLEINATYYTGATSRVTFEDGKTWGDVYDWYIKWDTLHVLFRDTTEWVEFTLESFNDPESTDWKRPQFVSIHPVLEDGVDYNTDYA